MVSLESARLSVTPLLLLGGGENTGIIMPLFLTWIVTMGWRRLVETHRNLAKSARRVYLLLCSVCMRCSVPGTATAGTTSNSTPFATEATTVRPSSRPLPKR